MKPNEPDYMRLFITLFLALGVLILWQVKVEWPRRQALAVYHAAETQRTQERAVEQAKAIANTHAEEDNPSLTREQRLNSSARVAIQSDTLHGSIALKGARFDDIRLAKYRETLDKDSPEVTLLSPNGDASAFFVQVGWVATDGKTKVPDSNSIWQADRNTLTAGGHTTLRWNNGGGVTFVLTVSLDEHYMFDINQRVENASGQSVAVAPYAYINRVYAEPAKHYGVMHEGPLGVADDKLNEISYKDLREKGAQSFEHASGWLGITDKYWLTALVPSGSYKSTFSHYSKGAQDRYQADYLSPSVEIASGAASEQPLRLFAGAKEVNVLDRYTNGDAQHPPVPLFDRAVDFGSLYFLTKPMFLMLNWFFKHVGNFGIAILLLTVVVKLCMYPLANKSYHASAQMRRLQPEMAKLRERHFDDQITMNKEMMALYKREKVNPASGCLPLFIQMPVFFALYKVLYVTIEMRHAPFFGWIRDLSAMDPSNIFTAFGLFPWDYPNWMHLAVLPMLMCITMFIQMRQQPKPADPVQAKMMTYMPFFMLFIFNGMPAGLVLYWTWSNLISILQMLIITKRHGGDRTGVKAFATIP